MGFEGRYEVSDCGCVKSVERSTASAFRPNHRRRGIVLKHRINPRGYHQVVLYRGDGVPNMRIVSVLVATAFVPNVENKPEVNHKDGNKDNNRADNLEWMTHAENIQHAFKIGLMRGLQGSEHPNYKDGKRCGEYAKYGDKRRNKRKDKQ